MSDFASSVSTDPEDEAPGDAALLHLLDGYYIKRHSVKAWNTSGGYCDVFTGDHPTFGKVALKRPRGDQRTERQLQSLRREALIWKGLHHPNILQFVGMIDTPNDVWLVSVFATNGTLHKYLHNHQEANRHNLVLQFTSGLAYLHSRNVVHGDLKSDNLLISRNHQLLVADFGLSKITGMSTNTSKKGAGAVPWMAPELLSENDPIKSSTSDVYACGIIISEILRGELPFNQYRNAPALIMAIIGNKRPPTTPQESQGKSYVILWAVAKACWHPEPSERPTIVEVCRRFSLDHTKPVDSAMSSGPVITDADETSHGSGATELECTLPEIRDSGQGIDFNPQPMNSTTLSSYSRDDRLLQLLGNAEHGDIGYMLEDGLCLEGTRVEILDRLDAWAADHQASPKVMLLKGQAGRGKSTIARSVSSRYRKRWGGDASSAIFHFRRGNEGLNARPFLALARQLGSSANQRIRTVILKSIRNHEDVAQLRLEEQFEVLFVQSLKELGPNPPRMILIIDALDECSDYTLISALLRLIRKHAPSLPSTFKFLLTTRPEEHIVGPFKVFPDSAQEDLDAIDLALIDRDVRSYFTTRLSEIQQEYGFNADWLPPKSINELVSLSQGLFQWAHAAMEYVRERPILNLQRLIRSPTNLLGLPALYKQILSTAFPLREDIKDDSNFLALIRHVIGSLVVAHRPMSLSILEYLWDNTPGRPPLSYPAIEIRDGIVGRLGSILMLPSTPEGPIHFMHASVRDFFTDPAQCKDERFLIDPSVHHTQLAFTCFDRMQKNLRQGIRRINDAKLESEVNDHVEQHLPLGLQYCCRSWSTHLSEMSDDGHGSVNNVQRNMLEFCTERLPYWIDCLGLIGVLSEAFDMIRRATGWLEDTNAHLSTAGIPATTLLGDTNDFCRQFFKHMSSYPRHVTLSYLLQFQSETALRKLYADSIGQHVPRIVRGPVLKRFDWSKVIRAGEAVLCLAFSPDGKILAFGLLDGTIRLWNMDFGEPMEFPLLGHLAPVNDLAFSPDSKTLASGSDDKTIRLWNMDTGEPKTTPLVGHEDRVTSIAYSPDGKTLASGSSDKTIRLWDMDNEAPTGTPIFVHNFGVTGIAYSPNGKSIASCSKDAMIRLWAANSNTGEPMEMPIAQQNHWGTSVTYSSDGRSLAVGVNDAIHLVTEGSLLLGHKSRVNSLAFSPDSKFLASGSDDATIRLWLKGGGTTLVGHKDRITSIAYSPDGKTLASSSYDSTLRLWNVDTGSRVSKGLQRVGHNSQIRNLVYSLDDKILASESTDNQIRLWNMDTGQQKGTLLIGPEARLTRITLSPDRRTLACQSDDGRIRLWDINTGKQKGQPLADQKAQLTSIAFASDRRSFASGADDHQIRLWDVDTGRQTGTLLLGYDTQVTLIAFSLDSKVLASGLDNYQICLWEISSGKQKGRPLAGHKARLTSIAFSSDGKTLASGSDDHQIRLWDSETGNQKGKPLVGHRAPVTSIAFSLDNMILASAAADNQILLWNVSIGEQTGSLLVGRDAQVTSVGFSYDGRTLASGMDNHQIRLWDVYTRKQAGTVLVAHDIGVTSTIFSLHGQTLAVTDDHEIRLWDINTGKQKGEPLARHRARVTSIAFSSDGCVLASSSDDGHIWLWDINIRQPQTRPMIGPRARLTSIALSYDGQALASGMEDHQIRLWNTTTGNQAGALPVGRNTRVTMIAFSPDGQTLAFGSDDHRIRLWDLNTGKRKGMSLTCHQAPVTSITFSSDSKILRSESIDNQIRLWDIDIPVHYGLNDEAGCFQSIASGQLKRKRARWPSNILEAQVTSIAHSLDGNTLAFGSDDNQIQLWNIDKGELKGAPLVGHQAQVTSIAFSPCGSILASSSDDYQLRLWDIDSGESQPLRLVNRKPEDRVHSLAFSSNGKILASGSYDGAIRLWTISAPCPRSKRLAGYKVEASEAHDRTPKLWDIELHGKPLVGRRERVKSLAFSPDGKALASGLDDNTIHLWNLDSGKKMQSPLTSHQDLIVSLAFSSDGKTIASGSVDGTIQLWNIATGKEEGIPLFGHQSYVASITLSLDGKTFVSHSYLASSYESIQWGSCHGDTSKSTTFVGKQDSNAGFKETDEDLQHPEAGSEKIAVALEDGSPLDISDFQLDLDSPEAYERGWVFIRGKRCFWLPPEFYLDGDNNKVDMSLFERRFLVFHHPNIHILDISAFL